MIRQTTICQCDYCGRIEEAKTKSDCRNDVYYKRVLALLLDALMFVLLVGVADASLAEADYTVFVRANSELNVRTSPGGSICGRVYLGDVVTASGSQGGWVYVEGLPTEAGDGWVCADYLVTGTVEVVDQDYTVAASGRVAVRETPSGGAPNGEAARVMWVHPGDVVHVDAVAGEWAVTDVGYIKSKFLEASTNGY